MREGCLSYERFCVEAELLQKRSHEVASLQAVSGGRGVATWEWRHGNRQHLDGDSYLVSTGNALQYQSEDEQNVKVDKDLGGDIGELLLAEEVGKEQSCCICVASTCILRLSDMVHCYNGKLLSDFAAAIAQEIVAEDDEVQTALQPEGVKTALVEFHIVYHTIYQTPVLYFRALAVDGTPLPTSVVTRGIQLPGSNGRSTFVAMEEHPVLGKPYSFLHPCETAAAMQLLQAQVQSSINDTKTPSEVEVPQYLASWLCLVQPLTGISPVDYYSVG